MTVYELNIVRQCWDGKAAWRRRDGSWNEQCCLSWHDSSPGIWMPVWKFCWKVTGFQKLPSLPELFCPVKFRVLCSFGNSVWDRLMSRLLKVLRILNNTRICFPGLRTRWKQRNSMRRRALWGRPLLTLVCQPTGIVNLLKKLNRPRISSTDTRLSHRNWRSIDTSTNQMNDFEKKTAS